jgi:hypothetical protein
MNPGDTTAPTTHVLNGKTPAVIHGGIEMRLSPMLPARERIEERRGVRRTVKKREGEIPGASNHN